MAVKGVQQLALPEIPDLEGSVEAAAEKVVAAATKGGRLWGKRLWRAGEDDGCGEDDDNGGDRPLTHLSWKEMPDTASPWAG